MNDSLGDTLAIKMGQQVDQMEVLEQEGAVLPNSLTGFRIVDGTAIRGGINGLFLVAKRARRLVVRNHVECRVKGNQQDR